MPAPAATSIPFCRVRVGLVRTGLDGIGAYNAFRKALVAEGLVVEGEFGSGLKAEQRRAIASTGGRGWVFVICRSERDDLRAVRDIQSQLAAAGMEKHDCIVLAPHLGHGGDQASAVRCKVELSARRLATAGPDRSPPPGVVRIAPPSQQETERMAVDAELTRPYSVVDCDTNIYEAATLGQPTTGSVEPTFSVLDGDTKIYESVESQSQPSLTRRRRTPRRRRATPEFIGAGVIGNRRAAGGRGLIAGLVTLSAVAALVAWQWDGIVRLAEGESTQVLAEASVGAPAQVGALDGERAPDSQAHSTPAQFSVTAPGDASPAPGHEGPEDSGTAAATAASIATAQQGERIAAGLERRSFRALDSILVDTQSSPRISFDEAATHCEALELDGVAGWRLPEIGELRSLSKMKMLRKARYWTAHAADMQENRQVVWNAANREIRATRRDSKRVRAVCVREHGEAVAVGKT